MNEFCKMCEFKNFNMNTYPCNSCYWSLKVKNENELNEIQAGQEVNVSGDKEL
jgi:hypothetical protein